MRQGSESPVGGRVRVAADDGHARQRGALFGSDDVDDALAAVGHVELFDVEPPAVLVQGDHLGLGDGILDAGDAARPARRRHVVVRRRQIGPEPPRLSPGQRQALERLGRSHLVQEVAIHVQDGEPVVAFGDGMRIPDLVVYGLACHAGPTWSREREW